MRAARLFGIVGVASLCGMSCAQSPPPGLVQPAAAVAAAPAASARQIPRSQASLPTTDAAITVGNFLSLYAVMPPGQRVSMLATHAQFFGALDDYDAALRAADELVKTRPAVAEAWLARAGARQSLHEFQGALADLAQAEKLGADRDAVAAGRAGVWQALGRYDEALAVRRRLVKVRATTATLAAYAVLRGEMGDVADAEAKFLDAQDAFEDVSPFTLAWLYFQNGLVEERAGRPAAARELYEAAHARLPEYAPATGHLATAVALAGDEQRAMALLEPLVAASDDPEYQAQLGVLLRRNGQAARGDELIARGGGATRRWCGAIPTRSPIMRRASGSAPAAMPGGRWRWRGGTWRRGRRATRTTWRCARRWRRTTRRRRAGSPTRQNACPTRARRCICR